MKNIAILTYAGLIIILSVLLIWKVTPAKAEQFMLNSTFDEIEPNNTLDDAQLMPEIGLGNVMTGTINPAGDTDFYRFNAAAGQAYVVEVFNVTGSVGSGVGYNCIFLGGSGLGVVVYNPAGDQIVRECGANGSNAVHHIAEFSTQSSGEHIIQLLSNKATTSGTYNLRVLLGYKSADAAWDSTTFEPNNRSSTAYLIEVGRLYTLTSSIETLDPIYVANLPDMDWYRFEAEADKEYSIEVFDAAAELGTSSGTTCDVFGRIGYGLWLTIYGPDAAEISRDCNANGAGNVHAMASFRAAVSGIHFVSLRPTGLGEAGSYKLRVLPKHDQPEASWDTTTFEPNNTNVTAYLVLAGRDNAIVSTVEQRQETLATNAADQDWYRFEALKNETYTVETFSVAESLASGFSTTCDAFGRSTRGLTVAIFTNGVDQIGRQCTANGSGEVHTFFEFTANYDGIHYIRVLPNNASTVGNYSLRIVTQADTLKIYLPLVRR